jgi:YihY family inner membrane protein
MVFKKRHLQRMGKVFAATGRMMLRHEVPRDAAGISYFTLLALFPAILIILSLADSFLGWMNPHYTIIQTIVDLFPGSRQFISSSLLEITEPSSTVMLSCIGMVLWSSSWIFTFIESSINRAWDIPNQRTFWESRLRTMALLALGSISLLSSAAITGFVGAARQHAAANIHSSEKATYFMGWFWYFFLLGTGLTIAIFVFALIYKWTPHCKVFWSEAFSGALVATILWEIGGHIFLNVVSHFDYQRVYGRMGATILLMAWVYTSNMILLFGANFSAQLHWIRMDLRGSNLIPRK